MPPQRAPLLFDKKAYGASQGQLRRRVGSLRLPTTRNIRGGPLSGEGRFVHNVSDPDPDPDPAACLF